jgi:hypothetical protein
MLNPNNNNRTGGNPFDNKNNQGNNLFNQQVHIFNELEQ